ncbi:MAG: ABC transporter permease subunit [Gammaproteobacteria bacterium]|nr:ABC transporter permease subunit [Gammaproteobacteria bacterium]
MSTDTLHQRRRRIDLLGAMATGAAALLVTATALLLMGYLLLSMTALLQPRQLSEAAASKLAKDFVPSFVGLAVATEASVVIMHDLQLLALHADSGEPLMTLDLAPSAEQSQARKPLYIELGDRDILIIDAAIGVGYLRWPASAAEAGLQMASAEVQWFKFPDADAGFDTAAAIPLQASLSLAGERQQLLTLWNTGRGNKLLLHSLQLPQADQPFELQLLAALDVDAITAYTPIVAGQRSSSQQLDWSALQISSLLADQAGGFYLGLSDGMLLHASTLVDEPDVLAYAGQAAGALVALMAMPQAGVLAASAQGSMQEYSRTADGLLVPIREYVCGRDTLHAVAVDSAQRWLACSADSQLRLFYLSQSKPVWQTGIDTTVSAGDVMAPNTDRKQLVAVQAGYLLLVDDQNTLHSWTFDTSPAVTASSLWQPQYYQGQVEPQWQWQPQASSQSPPRLSLVPLLFGTLKAATLGLLIGLPLALLGAIYTALMLPRRWRERIKPVVETLESLPTVTLGFIGALWLAPVLQNQLLSFLLLLLLTPLLLMLTGYYWASSLRQRVAVKVRPYAQYALFLLLLVALVGLGMLLQWLFFNGSFSAWLETGLGWTYDLHNALLVGLVLGLGIAPSIFALVEDALAAVPERLRLASLALGASRWQTVWKVMVPAAGAGILAAVLIGFGRALGETMIVLMVSSNSPIMASSVLRGMQAIAPTLASEMSAANPASMHFQVLLFAALVLFGLTFVMNSVAEFFRLRLRKRYQS